MIITFFKPDNADMRVGTHCMVYRYYYESADGQESGAAWCDDDDDMREYLTGRFPGATIKKRD